MIITVLQCLILLVPMSLLLGADEGLLKNEQLSVEVDALTAQYLSVRGMSKAPREKPYIPFLQTHNHECRHLHNNFKVVDRPSNSLIYTKKCSNCYKHFLLDKKSGDRKNSMVMILYRESKYRDYLYWLINMIFQLQVDIVDVNSAEPQVVDVCKNGFKRPMVFLGQYADFDYDLKSSKLSLKGIEYTCSQTKLAKFFEPAHVSKLLMLMHDPLLRMWRSFVVDHMPQHHDVAEGESTGMLGFNWTKWDNHLSYTIQSQSESILQAASQDLRVELGEALIGMPKSVVLPLRSDELTDRHEVDVYLFVELYLFVRGGNFSYTQVRYRREISPEDSPVFHKATGCLSSTFSKKNTSTGVDQLVQRYAPAAFSSPSISCKIQNLFAKNPFMKQFPLALPMNLTCAGSRDISPPNVKRVHKANTCRLRYPDRSYKAEITTALPVAIVGGYDAQAYDVRRLFEYASGELTGALKANMQVAASFPAESYCGQHVGAVHATSFNFKPYWSPYDLELRFDPATGRRCKYGLLFKLVEAVVVMDDPFLFLWRRHFDRNAAMYIRQLSNDKMTSSNTEKETDHGRRNLRRGGNLLAEANTTTPRKPLPTTLNEIFAYWDDVMVTEKSASSVFGDGAHLFLHQLRSTMMPSRSVFPVSYERLVLDAYALFEDVSSTYEPLSYNESTTNVMAILLKFAHFQPDDLTDRMRCAFAFVQQTGQTLLRDIAQAKEFYDSHPEYLCSVQTWVRNHTDMLSRRSKFLYPLHNICGQPENVVVKETSIEKCRDEYATRKYKDDTSVPPSTIVAPLNSLDAKFVRILIEHTTGLYSGALETSYQYKGVFPADEYCGRRMAVIHAAPETLSFSQREDGETYLRIESKGARTRCRRGVVTSFVESIVLIKDPFVLVFEILFPQLASDPVYAKHAVTTSAEAMFSSISQPFTTIWQTFNESLVAQSKQRQAKQNDEVDLLESKMLQRLEMVFTMQLAPNFTTPPSDSKHLQRHFLGSAVDEFIHSPYYEIGNANNMFFGSIEAIYQSAKRLSSLSADVDISQHVYQHREALFAMLKTAKLTGFVSIAQLQCGYAFINEEGKDFEKRMELVQLFYALHPKVLCRVQQWVSAIFAPHESAVYAMFAVGKHAEHRCG